MEFFSNELIRHLWSQYIYDENKEIKAYISQLR